MTEFGGGGGECQLPNWTGNWEVEEAEEVEENHANNSEFGSVPI
jgi:hypothetical protein